MVARRNAVDASRRTHPPSSKSIGGCSVKCFAAYKAPPAFGGRLFMAAKPLTWLPETALSSGIKTAVDRLTAGGWSRIRVGLFAAAPSSSKHVGRNACAAFRSGRHLLVWKFKSRHCRSPFRRNRWLRVHVSGVSITYWYTSISPPLIEKKQNSMIESKKME